MSGNWLDTTSGGDAPTEVTGWDPYLDEAAAKYNVDPALLKSITRQENVNPGDLNPLGISPGGGGPTHFHNLDAAKAAIDRQVALMVDPKGPYGDIRTKSIDQIAAVYSPVGASNDPYGTNSTEAAGISRYYNQIGGEPSSNAPPLPEHLDTSSFGFKDDDERYKKALAEGAPFEAQQKEEEQKQSLVQKYRSQFPEDNRTEDSLIGKMREVIAPTMPQGEFAQAAKSPDGEAIINDWKEQQKDPLQQIRDQHPEWAGYSDKDLSDMIYDQKVADKELDPEKLTKQQFAWNLKPPTDAVTQAERFVNEALAEAAPGTESSVLWGISSAQQRAIDHAEPAIKGILAKAYPGADPGAIMNSYQKMTPDQRTRDFNQAWNQPNSQHEPSDDPIQLSGDLNAAYEVLGKKAEYEKSIAGLNKMVGQLDAQTPNKLPPGQAKWARTISRLPADAFQLGIPVWRETGLASTLYTENKAAIQANNPGMSADELRQRADQATLLQFPGNELMALAFVRGGPAIVGTLWNRVGHLALQTGESVGTGALVGGTNQAIQNVAAGRDPLSGVLDASVTMATIGGTGRALGLTVESLSRCFKALPEVRQAMGISSDIIAATPEEANKIIAGDPTAEVNRKATRNAVDMILAAMEPLTPSNVGIEPPDTRGARRFTQNLGPPSEEYPGDVIQIKRETIQPEVTPSEYGDIAERNQLRGLETTDTLRQRYALEGSPERYAKEKEQAGKAYEAEDAGTKKPGSLLKAPIYLEPKFGINPEAEEASLRADPFSTPDIAARPGGVFRHFEPEEPSHPSQALARRPPAQEAQEKAQNARDNDDLDTAAKYATQARTLLAEPELTKQNKKVADQLKAVTQKSPKVEANTMDDYMGIRPPEKEGAKKDIENMEDQELMEEILKNPCP